jgi:hypothetical protein
MQKPRLFGMNGFLLFLLVFFSVAAGAQPAGSLILIDADNKQPFTVRIGDQLFASSGHGHLVLSHLKDSVYRLNLRFPKMNLAEQVFPVAVHAKDLGFQLKGADSSWVLYNWQTKQTIHPVYDKDSTRILEMGVKRDDGFSRLMAAVVNDTAVLYNTYTGTGFGRDTISAGSRFPVDGQPSTANTQPSTVNTQPSTVNRQPPTVSHQPSSAVPEIKKIREVSLKISRKMVFLDRGGDGKTDTVTLFVYFETSDTSLKKKPSKETLALKKPSPADAAGSAVRSKQGLKTAAAGCGQLATDEDAESLRSAILQANTEQDKISAATAAFAQKCYTTGQVRLLASLLVSDKARYRLMDAARGHISDRDHFPELADMYTDKNFQKKFLAMAEKRS